MRIGVVGAGIAGLRTALLLQEAGLDVQVFEARDRVGGRLHTVPVAGGGFYEAGGEWIDKDHARCMALLEEFGMQAEPSHAWPGIVVCQGDIQQEDSLWPDAEQDAEGVHDAAVQYCRQMREPAWENTHLAGLDQQSLDEFLDLHCLSPRGRWWLEAVQRSDEGDDSSSVGLLGWLAGYRMYLSREEGDMSICRFPGGAGAFCQLMAGRLRRPVLTSHRLRSAALKEDIVELWFDGEMAFCDRAVFTIPPKGLLEIDFGDDLEAEKEIAWEVIGSSRAIKVALEFSEPWWEARGWTGRIMSDLPFQQCWASGREGAHVLTAYIGGDEAERVTARQDPVRSVLRAISEVAPEAEAAFKRGQVHDWITDPWSKGAFSHLAPGAVMAAMPHLSSPSGRAHFAGESTAEWIGTIEGALESAERAAKEVLVAIQLEQRG